MPLCRLLVSPMKSKRQAWNRKSKKEFTVTTICCVCKRVKNGDAWELKPVDGEALLSHGYCPSCYENAQLKIEKLLNIIPGIQREMAQ